MTSDPLLFVWFVLIGLGLGAIWGLTNHIVYWAKHNTTKYILRFVFDIITPILATFIIIVVSNIYNFGQIRWFFIVGTLIGLAIERKTIGKMFAKLNVKLYNSVEKTKAKFLSTKLGRRITK